MAKPTDSNLDQAVRAWSWYRRHRVAVFLAALVAACISAPFEEQLRDGDLLEALRLTIVLVSGLLAVGVGRRALAGALMLAVPALLAKWVNHWRPDLAPPAVFLVPGILFLVFAIARLLRFIAHAPRVDSEVLCAGVAGYLMLGLLWAFAYILTARLVPDSFALAASPAGSQAMKGFTALYYSFITLTTVGYGDIAPLSGAARMLAMMEAMTGTFYVAILISRLVSLFSSSNTPTSSNPGFRP